LSGACGWAAHHGCSGSVTGTLCCGSLPRSGRGRQRPRSRRWPGRPAPPILASRSRRCWATTSLRCDAAWCHGLQAAADVLRGWEAEAGRLGSHVPYWDVVAALASPPDMGWFPESMAAQGRPDLTREVMIERRDAFLVAALSQLQTVG
jgi:hypothetical protein